MSGKINLAEGELSRRDTVSAAAAAIFETLNWPSPSEEAWRRTDLARLLPKGFLDACAAGPGTGRPGARQAENSGTSGAADLGGLPAPLLPEGCAARVITHGGVPSAAFISPEAAAAGLKVEWAGPGNLPAVLDESGRSELNTAADRVTAWHWRDLPGSIVVRVPRNTVIEGALIIEERLVTRGVTAPHLHIDAGQSSSVVVVWSFEGSPADGDGTAPVVNAGLDGRIGPDARADITVRQKTGDRVVFFLHDRLNVERDGRLVFRESHLGGALVKTRSRVTLSGEGADARLKGLYVAREGRHVDIGTLQEHRSPRATSDALYKGAVHPGGRSVFQGLIEVAPGAPKTDAYLTNNNLVLGEGARADSIPQLNILTDDVKCSHGSTTGKLDPGQIFYLQSRGFSPDGARRELTRAFLNQVLLEVPESVSMILSDDLDAALSIT